MKIASLVQMKFYLNKFVKADNIEDYSFDYCNKLYERYHEFLKDNNGVDPDYPDTVFKVKL